jgi:hypothetical protein
MTNNCSVSQKQYQNVFYDAEHLWFWFISSRNMQNGFRNTNRNMQRPCELLDIEILVTQLYLSGRLSVSELEVIKKYGEMKRCPNLYMWNENRDAALWLSAMRSIGTAARSRGWIE